MDKAAEYLCEEIDKCYSGIYLLSVLNVLITTLDENPQFKNNVSKSPIITSLFKIIQDPDKHLQKNFELQKREQVSFYREQVDISRTNTSEILSLIRRSGLQCILCIIHKIDFDTLSRRASFQILLNFLDPDVKYDNNVPKDLFHFTGGFTSSLRDIVFKTTGIKVIARNIEIERQNHLSAISELKYYEPLLMKLSPIILTQIPICLCNLEAKSDGKSSVEITDSLVSKGLAWHRNRIRASPSQQQRKAAAACCTAKLDPLSQQTSDDNDILITEVMNGNFFWILKGKETIRRVSQIHGFLVEQEGTLQQASLKLNVTIAARISSASISCGKIIRGKILAFEQNFVTVFGVDIGGLHRVHERDLFFLPSMFSLSTIPAQVSLGRLKDVLPIPSDPVAMELVLGIFTKMARLSSESANSLIELQVLPLLPTLVDCPDGNITKQALSLAVNLTLKWRHRCENDLLNVILVSLDMVNQFIIKLDHDNDRDNVKSDQSLSKGNTSPKSLEEGHLQETNSLEGSPLSLNKRRFSCHQSLTYSSFLLMANFVHMNKLAKNYFYQQDGLETVLRAYMFMKKNHHLRQVAIRLLSNFVHVNTKNQLIENQVSACEKQGLALVMLMDDNQVMCQSREDEEDEDEDLLDLQVPNFEEEISFESTQEEESISLSSPDKTKTKMYFRDSRYPFAKYPTHELHENINLESNFLASVLCGMLNTGHGGTISLGVSEDGLVKGVKISHSVREGLRGGIKDIMDYHLEPPLLYPQLEIKFVPVVPSHATEADINNGIVYDDLFVVEITCQPLPGIVYSCKNNQSFYRFGFKTRPLNEQDMRHLVVIEEEASDRERIQELQAVVRRLKLKATMSS